MKLIATILILISVSASVQAAETDYLFSSFDLMDLQKVARQTSVGESFTSTLIDSGKSATCTVTEKVDKILKYSCEFTENAETSVVVSTDDMDKFFRTMNIPVMGISSVFELLSGDKVRCTNEPGAFTCEWTK